MDCQNGFFGNVGPRIGLPRQPYLPTATPNAMTHPTDWQRLLTNRPSWLILFAVTLCTAFAATTAFADCTGRQGDRILLVSTRPVGCSTDCNRLSASSYAAERISNKWVKSDTTSLLASLNPSIPTVVYVHGNQIDASSARKRGLDVYRCLTRSACDERPIQFVVFSWASTKVPGLLRDYREKAARTRPVAAQLAWVVNQVPEGAPVGILGYSYGARVSSGAAHLLAGGALNGLRLCETSLKRPMRAVFLAAAEDACWIAPGRYHGMALYQLDSLLVTCNPKDPAMKFYKFVSKISKPTALGYTGPKGLTAGISSQVRTINVSSSVGRSHDLYRYLNATGVMRATWRRLTFSDLPTASEPTLAMANK